MAQLIPWLNLSLEVKRPTGRLKLSCATATGSLEWIDVCGPGWLQFLCPVLPPTDPWRELSRQTLARWSRCRNASSCKRPRTRKQSNLSLKIPPASLNIQAAKIMCLVFFHPFTHPGKRRLPASAKQSRPSRLKQTPWLISVSTWGKGWGARKSKDKADGWRGAHGILLQTVWTPPEVLGGREQLQVTWQPAANETLLTHPLPRTKMIGTKRVEKLFRCLVDIPRCFTARLYYLLMHLLY